MLLGVIFLSLQDRKLKVRENVIFKSNSVAFFTLKKNIFNFSFSVEKVEGVGNR